MGAGWEEASDADRLGVAAPHCRNAYSYPYLLLPRKFLCGLQSMDFRTGGTVMMARFVYGATCDNLLAVDIVTAEGQFLTTSATQHAALFWGVRGGGGTFGIVTSLTYQLHPVGPIVLSTN